MAAEVAGIRLRELEEPVRFAVITYEAMLAGRLQLDPDAACLLDLTPDKPNSARSATPAFWQREKIGDLYVIAFKPFDGTGDEKTFSLDALRVAAGLPREPKVVPRSKAGVGREVLLPILRQQIDTPNADPEFFRGSFELLGLEGDEIRAVAMLGDDALAAAGLRIASPHGTFTVGQNASGERYGDPHAVYSNVPDHVQLCAFLAISVEVAASHPGVLERLRVVEPLPL